MDEDEIRDSLLNTNDDEFEYDTQSSFNSLDVSDNDIESEKEDNPEALEIDSETEQNNPVLVRKVKMKRQPQKAFALVSMV